MPVSPVPGFVGPAHTLRAIQADADETINFYTEGTAPGTAKTPVWLQATPGIRLFSTFYDQPIRGMLEINERAFVVGGASFAELKSDGTLGPPFAIATDGGPVSMASNGSAGHQVIVISDGLGYIYDLNANTFVQITDPDFPANARQAEFMDGYFLVSQGAGSRKFQWSALEDGLTWDALDVAERSEAADNLVALIRSHREIWLLGGRTSEVWYDQGDVNTPFAPIQGVFLEHGVIARFSVQRADNTLLWLGANADGQAVVWRADGYTPKRISTFAVEWELQQRRPSLVDARAFVYQLNGHIMYCLLCPEAPTFSGQTQSAWTWVYDVTMDRWHKWAIWDAAKCIWTPHVAGCHIFVFGKHLFGDRFSRGIYVSDQTIFDDEVLPPV